MGIIKQTKGCLEKECVACKKKRKYKFKDNYCVVCGSQLQIVCRKCHTRLPDGYTETICDRCKAQAEDKKDHGKKNAGKAAAAVAGAGAAAVAIASGIKKVAEKVISG